MLQVLTILHLQICINTCAKWPNSIFIYDCILPREYFNSQNHDSYPAVVILILMFI